MSNQARITDMGVGICICHSPPIPMTGSIITGSTDSLCNNLGVARIGDIVLGLCGHTGTIDTGSTVAFANSKGKSRLGDTFSGCFNGTITTGSINQFTG